MLSFCRNAFLQSSARVRPWTRFVSTQGGEATGVSSSSSAEKPVILTPKHLKIVPREVSLTSLELQDEVIKRQRKLSKEHVKLKKFKPTSPGVRWYRAPIHTHLWRGRPFYALTSPKKQTGGRNHHGKIVVRHRGGGHKRRLRLLDFKRMEPGMCKVLRIEYDPNRSAHIALIENEKTLKKSYIIATEGLRAGDIVESFRQGIPEDLMKQMGGDIDPAILASRTTQRGNCLPMHMIPVGAVIHNIAMRPHGDAQLCRAAGTYGRLVSKHPELKKAIVRLQSGEQRYVHYDAFATLGTVSNSAHQHRQLGKAGRSRWRGIRPTVRGLAMNKCDHPHGGGRGKTKSHKLSQSKWGTLAKCGYKTRRGKNVNRMLVKDRPRGKSRSRA